MTFSKKDSASQSIDKWLETLFLDPLTSYLDETAFRIDLFESASQFIIEAIIPENNTDILVSIKEKMIDITVLCDGLQLNRQVDWPFDVREHVVNAIIVDQILEICIQKEKSLPPVDQLIQIKG